MKPIVRFLRETDRVPLMPMPTPLHPMHYQPSGKDVSLFIKRDDMTGVSLGGNKVRKLEYLLADAKEKGYVTTMFGRRRPVPELKSSNFMQRSFGERVAMNAPIQGTAADIIKIAMIRVDEALRAAGMKSRLILQVHDELILEVAEKDAEHAKQLLKEEMEHAAELKVTLTVDVSSGKTWYDAKE